jgi:hypothetical protein
MFYIGLHCGPVKAGMRRAAYILQSTVGDEVALNDRFKAMTVSLYLYRLLIGRASSIVFNNYYQTTICNH